MSVRRKITERMKEKGGKKRERETERETETEREREREREREMMEGRKTGDKWIGKMT